MEVLSDAKKIVKQILALENGFGYKTTLANQLYLCFCCLGNSHFTDKLHLRTKIVWLAWTLLADGLALVALITYFIYGRQSNDVLLLIYNGFTTSIILLEMIFKPAVLIFRCRNELEEMIELADKICMKSVLSRTKPKVNVKTVSLAMMSILWVSLSIYLIIISLDVILFYEEEKIKNYNYFFVPLSGLDRYGSLTFFIAFNGITSILAISVFLMMSAFILFIVISTAICRNEGERIVNELNSLNDDYDIDIDNYASFEPQFRRVMETSLDDMNELTRMTSHLQYYLESVSGVSMMLILYIEITHALIFVSPNYPSLVKMRELAVFLATILLFYIKCWAGDHLEELKSDLAFAVYSTPWYWLKSVRQDVYVLLCQAQNPIDLRAFNAYPLTLATFLRFLNVIHSTVNIFRSYEY